MADAPPAVPAGVPSELLERRPDIAAAERRVAAANAQLGVATAAFYPRLILSATAGFESSPLASLLTGTSSFWSVGPALLVNAFDAGRRRAASDQARAAQDEATASYRQAVLIAFREVEDQLAALRILDEEATIQRRAVEAAERSLMQATNRYRGGARQLSRSHVGAERRARQPTDRRRHPDPPDDRERVVDEGIGRRVAPYRALSRGAAQPEPRVLVAGTGSGHQLPEFRRVIHPLQVHQFVDQHVIPHALRHRHQPPVETDVAVA